jgi:hypothetical protein
MTTSTTATPTTYLSKQQSVTAIQWTGDNLSAIQAFMAPGSPLLDAGLAAEQKPELGVYLADVDNMRRYPSLGRQVRVAFVARLDWLVRQADGELAVVGAEVFAGQYQPINIIENRYSGNWIDIGQPIVGGDVAKRIEIYAAEHPAEQAETLKDA